MDRVTEHAWAVVNGKIRTGDTERKACQRHLDDLERQNTEKFPYYWDVEKANDLIDFAETLNIAEGFERQPLKLKGFQTFIFGSWHGWRNKKGFRRFRTSYVQVARQNGKSIMNAVPCLFYGNFSGYKYPQVFCAATKADQAKIVLKECYKFINSDEEMSGTKYERGLFSIVEYESKIVCNQTGGEIRALGRDTKTADGFRPYFASVDEFHQHPNNEMLELLRKGTRRLDECLISIITTAGYDLSRPCYEHYEYCKKILSGVVESETDFIYICEPDENDDIFDESVWIKSNPFSSDELIEIMRIEANEAKSKRGNTLRDFYTKSNNVWMQITDNQYMNYDHWKKCATDKTLDDFKGYKCYVGLDLSSGGDLTSLSIVIPYEIEKLRKYYVYSHSFIPKNRVYEHIQTDQVPYDIWIREGLLTVTETLGGVKTDYKYIIAHLKKLITKYELDVQMICYDPANASAFLYDLEELGYDSLEIRQSPLSLNDATIDFKLEVEAGNVEYDKRNKLLTWSIINAKTVSNSYGEIKIDKEKITQRIDPVDSVIDAWKVAMKKEGKISVDEFTEEDFLKKLWG